MPAFDLSTRISGIRLDNPVILASGILDVSSGLLKKMADSGAGAVVTKSVGLRPRKGNPNPTVVAVHGGLLNSMGLCNPGISEFLKELGGLSGVKVPVIGSVYAGSPEEFAHVAKEMSASCVRAVELNVSCPNVGKGECFGEIIGKSPKLVARVVSKVKSAIKKPVIVKLTPNVSDIVEIALAAEKAGADAITAVNTFGPGMVINVDARRPVLGGLFGGMSGPAVKPLAVACVYKLHESVSIPIIGCGGVSTGKDVAEYMMAGASAVEVGTAVYYDGGRAFGRINRELASFMRRRGIKAVGEMVGCAHGK